MLEKWKIKKYDQTMRNKACVGFFLRVLVSGYIVYLAWMIAFGTDSSESSMPLWCVILFCSLFGLSAVVFIIYSIISFKKSLKNAEIIETPEA